MRFIKVQSKYLLLTVACSVAVFIVGYAIIIVSLELLYFEDDAYAKWGAVDMVIRYMREHEGEWPRSWDDLRELYDAGGGRVSGSTFEEYQSRIFIDFTADPKQLKELSLQPGPVKFNVIDARWTSSSFGDGPNDQLQNYFRLVAREQAEQSKVEVTD
ncbi:hypothetical protein [Schlesneria sp. T3-172]|uniref:hypothetical protein n=1 Tax=Schlesneria sphaerica TaxID=3373610 RepID=UPI0037C90E68